MSAQQDAGAQYDLDAARREGALGAHLVVTRQAEAGMSPDAIEASAERVIAEQHATSDPADLAFFRAYDATAATYTRGLREMEIEELEAG